MAQPPVTFRVKDAKDAVSLLRDVSARFASNPSVHTQFCHILMDFGKGEIDDVSAVAAVVEALLQGHPDLIVRFNAFLCPEYQIKVSGDQGIAAAKRRRKNDNRRRRTAVVADDDDDDLAKALQFLARVKRVDAELYGRLRSFLDDVKKVKMDAHEIYAEAGRIFGEEHGDLLRGFAMFLPTEHDLPPRTVIKQEEPDEPRRASKRKAAAAAAVVPNAVAGDATNRPSGAKKPRADDHRKNGHAAAIDSTSKRASSGGATEQGRDGATTAFRAAWEFETMYSNLVAAIRRAEKLKQERRDQAGPSAPRAFEDLFPSHHCRKVLQGMYSAKWRSMQEALTDGGERADLALVKILDRLRQKEAAAVAVEMARRDASRAMDRLMKLVKEQQGKVLARTERI